MNAWGYQTGEARATALDRYERELQERLVWLKGETRESKHQLRLTRKMQEEDENHRH